MRSILTFGLLCLLQFAVAQSPTIPCSQICQEEDMAFENVPLDDNFFCTQGEIQLAGLVRPDQQVTFLAGSRIKIIPGFRAAAGSSIRAFTDNCTLSPSMEERTIQSPNFSFEIAPNPIFYEGQIAIYLPKAAEMNIRLTDINGRITHTLVHRKLFEQGAHTFQIDVRELPAGVYFASLHIHGNIHTKHVLVAK